MNSTSSRIASELEIVSSLKLVILGALRAFSNYTPISSALQEHTNRVVGPGNDISVFDGSIRARQLLEYRDSVGSHQLPDNGLDELLIAIKDVFASNADPGR